MSCNLLTSKEIASLAAATTEDEWNKICDEIKAARDGKYPTDWYDVAIDGELNIYLDVSLSISTIDTQGERNVR